MLLAPLENTSPSPPVEESGSLLYDLLREEPNSSTSSLREEGGGGGARVDAGSEPAEGVDATDETEEETIPLSRTV